MVNDKFRTNNKYLFQGRPSSVDSLMVSKIVNFVRENKDNNSTTDIIKEINDCFPEGCITRQSSFLLCLGNLFEHLGPSNHL